MATKKHFATVQMTKTHIDLPLYESDGSDLENALDILKTCFGNRKKFKFISKHVAFDWYNFSYNTGDEDVKVSVDFRPIKKAKKGSGSIINLDKKK